MRMAKSIAKFNQSEVKLLIRVLKVQTYVKSNSAGDQKGLDTPGITALADLTQTIKTKGQVDLAAHRDLDSNNYAEELRDDITTYLNYADSINILTPKLKKNCLTLQDKINNYLKKQK